MIPKRLNPVIPLLLLIVSNCAPSPSHKQAAPAPAKPEHTVRNVALLVGDVNIVNVETGKITPHQDVYIDGGRIIAIKESPDNPTNTNIPASFNPARSYNAKGQYLIPGLWDMHAHIRSNTADDLLPMFITHGVTGLRDLGLTDHYLLKKWKKDISAGTLVGPRIISSGVIIEGAKPRFPDSISISTLEEVVPKLDSLIADDVELIKIFQNVPGDVFTKITAYASQKGLQTSGHIPTGWTQYQAAEAGLDSIEHLFGINDTLKGYEDGTIKDQDIDALATTLIKNNIYQSPTLVNAQYFSKLAKSQNDPALQVQYFNDNPDLALVPAYFRAWWKGIHTRNRTTFTPEQYKSFEARLTVNSQIIAKLSARGVKILAGTDVPNPYIIAGVSLHDELQLYVDAGMLPLEALRTATLYPAQYFGNSNLDLIAPNAIADLVLLKANPLEEIAMTRNINAVIANGRLYNSENLEQLRETQRNHLATIKPTDFDQFVYMAVRRNGIETVRESYLDLNTENPTPEGTPYTIAPQHLRRLASIMIEAKKPGEARLALEWNLTLFPNDDLSKNLLKTLK